MILRIFLILILFNLGACSQAGWSGYYTTNIEGEDKYIAQSSENFREIQISKTIKIGLELPRNCSTFRLAGFFTPFTPPIPIIFFRSWTTGFFTAETKPRATLHLKIIDSKTKQEIILEPKTEQGKWGYTKHIFPIHIKNIDSGIIIIEKDQEKIEVPFKYKYFKFLY
jgi:hypothetical protein